MSAFGGKADIDQTLRNVWPSRHGPGGGGGGRGGRGGGGFSLGGWAALNTDLHTAISYSRLKLISRIIRP